MEELPPFRVKDLLRHDACSLQGFADLLRHTVDGARHSSSGLIFNTLSAIEAGDLDKIRHDLSLPVFAVAPLHKLAPPANTSSGSLYGETHANRECLGWLDTQEPGSVLYVSFGSLAAMDPHEFLELAWGLAASKWPFLWVVRPKLIRGFESGGLPDGLDDEMEEKQRENTALGGGSPGLQWRPRLPALLPPLPCCSSGRYLVASYGHGPA